MLVRINGEGLTHNEIYKLAVLNLAGRYLMWENDVRNALDTDLLPQRSCFVYYKARWTRYVYSDGSGSSYTWQQVARRTVYEYQPSYSAPEQPKQWDPRPYWDPDYGWQPVPEWQQNPPYWWDSKGTTINVAASQGGINPCEQKIRELTPKSWLWKQNMNGLPKFKGKLSAAPWPEWKDYLLLNLSGFKNPGYKDVVIEAFSNTDRYISMVMYRDGGYNLGPYVTEDWCFVVYEQVWTGESFALGTKPGFFQYTYIKPPLRDQWWWTSLMTYDSATPPMASPPELGQQVNWNSTSAQQPVDCETRIKKAHPGGELWDITEPKTASDVSLKFRSTYWGDVVDITATSPTYNDELYVVFTAVWLFDENGQYLTDEFFFEDDGETKSQYLETQAVCALWYQVSPEDPRIGSKYSVTAPKFMHYDPVTRPCYWCWTAQKPTDPVANLG
jgi:hypothetical protein